MSISTETKTESNGVALWILFCFKDTTINATIRDVTSHLATFHLSFIALLSNILIYRYLTDQIHLFPVRFNSIHCIIMNLSSFPITKKKSRKSLTKQKWISDVVKIRGIWRCVWKTRFKQQWWGESRSKFIISVWKNFGKIQKTGGGIELYHCFCKN